MRGMKSTKGLLPTSGAVFVVVIGILAMIMSYIVFYMMTGTKTQVFLDASRMYQLGVLSSDIKSFLETASGYAFDQSVFDTLSDGVLTADAQQSIAGVRVWKNLDADASPKFGEMQSALEERYKEVMAQYLLSLKSKQSFMMEEPTESDVSVQMELRSEAVSEAPSTVDTRIDPIKIGTSKNSYALVDATTHRGFGHMVAAVFNKGKELLSSSGDIEASIQGVNYCMSDTEIKNEVCGAVTQHTGDASGLTWSMSCEEDKMSITKSKESGRYALDVTVKPLVSVEDKYQNMLVFDGTASSWNKLGLNYYMVVSGSSYVDCCPFEPKDCTDEHGCAGTSTCGSDYKWGSCENECVPDQMYGACELPDKSIGEVVCIKEGDVCSKQCK